MANLLNEFWKDLKKLIIAWMLTTRSGQKFKESFKTGFIESVQKAQRRKAQRSI